MTEQEMINAEKREIDLMLEKGVSITIERKIYKRIKGFKGFLGKRIAITEQKKYTIQEPTASTLFRIASEQVQITINEADLISENSLQVAKKLAFENARRMAKILAYAILGEDYVIAIKKGEGYRYEYDDKQLEELTEILFTSVKPSKLLEYSLLVNSMCNLGDFTNSIRLMSANRLTMPIRVEENTEV
jgi:hypothetical protein